MNRIWTTWLDYGDEGGQAPRLDDEVLSDDDDEIAETLRFFRQESLVSDAELEKVKLFRSETTDSNPGGGNSERGQTTVSFPELPASNLKWSVPGSYQQEDPPEDEEKDLITKERLTHTIMEVLPAREIGVLTDVFLLSLLLSSVYTFVVVMLSMTTWAVEFRAPVLAGWAEYVTLANIPQTYKIIMSAANILLWAISVFTALFYVILVCRTPRRSILVEQVWICLFVCSVALYMVPMEEALFLWNTQGNADNEVARQTFSEFARNFQLVRNVGLVIFMLFFPWAMMHSYRLLHLSTWNFYKAKATALLIVATVAVLAFYVWNVTVTFVPLTTLVYCLRDYVALRDNHPTNFIYAGVLTTIAEALVIALILRTVVITKARLDETDYVQYRTRHVGFVFFRWISSRFFAFFLFNAMALAIFVPLGTEQLDYIRNQLLTAGRSEYLGVMLGQHLLIASWTAITAYLMLPSTTHVSWRSSPYRSTRDEEPITYCRSSSAAATPPGCFVMDTHVHAFNCAWLAYYGGTKKMDKYRAEAEDYKLVNFSEMSTDTKLTIARTKTNVIVAFRGTSSLKNVKHDVKVSWKRLAKVFPEVVDLGHPHAEDAMVHSGFAAAYCSVAGALAQALRELDTDNLPIIATGHSLGGALATMFALHMAITRHPASVSMTVSTFGCPRVGNKHFRKLYDAMIPRHWRLELAPDTITRVPPAPYEHAGKQALLTEGGDLLLDPSRLDMHIQTQRAGVLSYHRKAAYLAAMIRWCQKQHGDLYAPGFLSFPLKSADKNMFRLYDDADRAAARSSGRTSSAAANNQFSMVSDGSSDQLSRRTTLRKIAPRVLRRWKHLAERVAVKLESEGRI